MVCLVLSVVYASQAQDQTTACAQVLRSARAVYEDGRLHELPALLTPCLTQGFSKEERVEALRFLTLTYIYLGEPNKADESMIRLLKADHFYEINEAVDPTEFINLYRQFKTDPVFSVGFIFGVNNTQTSVINTHYVFPNGAGAGNYTGNININLGVSFEKDFGKKFTLNPELLFVNRAFTYTNDNLFFNQDGEPIENSGNSAKHSQAWLDFNALVQYKISEKRTSSYYILLGPAMQYLMSSNAEIETRTGTQVVSGPGIDLLQSSNQLNYAASIGVGARFRIGSVYFRPDIRYQYGFTNITDPNNRQQIDSEALIRYGMPINDYRNQTIMVNVVAIMYPYFNPKKKQIKE